ncbi:MAG: polyprenyl synthetase family protein [Prevotellaceae bacterium]|nr:polyprenyl synthetase family protein [Prevotellaceae bacterium]
MYSSDEILKMVNDGIDSLPYDRQPRGLYEPVRYVLSLGGKRIRPVLMMLAYNLYQEDPKEILLPAIGLETYHNYTLLHDDLMDRADVRRGKPTVHKLWNDNAAILSGDSMLVLAYERILACDERHLPQVLRLFTRTALEIGEGQQYDMEFETRNDVTEAEYIEMIRLKTSVLLACALKLGAILADAPQTDADALYRVGERLGLAFQLQDDYLDVYGDFAVFGKKIGGDILCNKKTFMLINAFLLADARQRGELLSWMQASDYRAEQKISAVTRLYNELGIPALATEKINSFYNEAEQTLQQIDLPAERKQQLLAFMRGMLHRQS